MSLELRDICQTVEGENWLYDINLEAGNGLTILAGPTRAGKTSIMRIAAGLDRPTSGSVLLDGEDITRLSVRRRDVGFVYQEFINYPALSVAKNIAAPLEQAGSFNKAEISERVQEVADLLKLGHYMKRRPGELSGGQQQRVAIARALAGRARLLVFDEPLANLDYKLREELRDELFRIFESRESIVLYSTTEPVEALTFGGTTAVMDEGRILQHAPAIEAFRAPASAAVARVFSDPPMNLLDATVADGKLMLADIAPFAVPEHFHQVPDGALQLGLRPHRVEIERRHENDVEFRAELTLAELTGSETYLYVDHPAGRLTAQVTGAHASRLGHTLSLFAHPDALFAFSKDEGALLASPAWTAVNRG